MENTDTLIFISTDIRITCCCSANGEEEPWGGMARGRRTGGTKGRATGRIGATGATGATGRIGAAAGARGRNGHPVHKHKQSISREWRQILEQGM